MQLAYYEHVLVCDAHVCCIVSVSLCIMPQCACAEGILLVGSCICHSVYWLYVCNSDFPKVAKNQMLANAVQAQCNNISDLIALVL